ncbi:MAG: M15 family metallopeptidase [Saccharofermentans sp.]|nr:M15 family metallopeptidase [Saccharofermentans sp.]
MMEGFYISEIDDVLFASMQGKSFKSDCTTLREDLRLVHVLHVGFDDLTHEGELVVNKSIAFDTLSVFEKLFEARYPIERIELIDKYDADDEASMRANNSSAFNFRFISYTTTVSNHGMGLAIDINPLYNPYVKMVGDRLSIEPLTGAPYVDRSLDTPYKIDHDDLAYKLFIEAGFTWGGDWVGRKDYQHFEKV